MRGPAETSARWLYSGSFLRRNFVRRASRREGTSTKAKGDDGALSKLRLALFFCARRDGRAAVLAREPGCDGLPAVWTGGAPAGTLAAR